MPDLKMTSAELEALPAALGARIRQVRTGRGLSLRGLAGQLGVSPATMSAIEHGRTSISTVRLAGIANELGVSLESLLVESPDSAAGEVAATAGAWREFGNPDFPQPLQAALEAFVELGYHGSTMRDIAGRASLSVPGIYHHYSSKHDMLVEILERTMDDLKWRMDAAFAEGDDPVSRFELLVECLALFHTQRRDWGFIGRSELRSLEPDALADVRERRAAVQEMVTAEVKAGCASGAFAAAFPEGAARAVVVMCLGLTQWFTKAGPDSAERVAQEYVEYALNIVRGTPVESR